MEISSREQDSVTIVSISGELNVATAPIAQAKIESLITSGRRKLVIDLTGLQRVTSSGLGVIAHTLHLLRDCGGAMKLANLGSMVREAFEIWLGTLKEKWVPIYDSTQEAVMAFKLGKERG